jgi:hypothetical protein
MLVKLGLVGVAGIVLMQWVRAQHYTQTQLIIMGCCVLGAGMLWYARVRAGEHFIRGLIEYGMVIALVLAFTHTIGNEPPAPKTKHGRTTAGVDPSKVGGNLSATCQKIELCKAGWAILTERRHRAQGFLGMGK